MRPPSIPQRLFGNPVSALVLMLTALFVIFRWLTGDASGLVAFGLALVAGYSAKAYERVAAYSAWKREWDMMNGKPRGSSWRLPRIGGLRYILGGVAWVFLALLAIGSADDLALRIPVMLFWLATAVMVVAGIYRLVRGGPRRARDGDSVRVCLGRPVLSPSVEEARKALPHYC